MVKLPPLSWDEFMTRGSQRAQRLARVSVPMEIHPVAEDEATAAKTTATETMEGETTAVERVTATETGGVVTVRSPSHKPITPWKFKPGNLPSSPVFPPIFFDTIKFEFNSMQ